MCSEISATGAAAGVGNHHPGGYNRDEYHAVSAMSAPAQRTHTRHAPPAIVTIGSLDQEGRGIARIDGKAVFVEELPGPSSSRMAR